MIEAINKGIIISQITSIIIKTGVSIESLVNSLMYLLSVLTKLSLLSNKGLSPTKNAPSNGWAITRFRLYHFMFFYCIIKCDFFVYKCNIYAILRIHIYE